jgi:uncharacterized protein YndB with AHSA1/START domain
MNPVTTAAPLAVRKTVTVQAPQEIAFEVFTARIESWWPMATHKIGQADCAAVVIEPRTGGRWFERGTDGAECDWGRVLAWEPPARVVLAWQLSARWAFDPALHTEVEVRFHALDARTTEVSLEHRGLEAYGDAATAMRDIFQSPSGGWTGMLEHYARVASDRA